MTPTQMLGTTTSGISFTVDTNQPAILTSPTQSINNIDGSPSNAARNDIFTIARNFMVGLIVGMDFGNILHV
ncbi:10697_t:CDS:2 [Ambispora leptoticha]|uniref:10697_t:CDS:1 n=1 Tax=Ambispora leptoticha TaxID=144679 RepID=A0A9N9FBL2_9GLOM|nr:10697_t:CDS:2 [Ambispora leptoticha]